MSIPPLWRPHWNLESGWNFAEMFGFRKLKSPWAIVWRCSSGATTRGDRWDVSHPTFLRVGFVPPNNFDTNVLSSRAFTASYLDTYSPIEISATQRRRWSMLSSVRPSEPTDASPPKFTRHGVTVVVQYT